MWGILVRVRAVIEDWERDAARLRFRADKLRAGDWPDSARMFDEQAVDLEHRAERIRTALGKYGR